jgi:hypothetical protein
MPFWKQNAANIPPRNGTAPVKDYYPLSYTVFEPAAIPQAMDNPGSTLPSDGYRASPSFVVTKPSFGQHDALHGAIMMSAQADFYQSAVGPFPRAGTWEEPGGPIAALRMVRLAPTTSAHPGLQQATGAGPTMVFQAPPVFTVQSKPIYALGL